MKFGFIKVMAASPKLKVGDTAFNLESARECACHAVDRTVPCRGDGDSEPLGLE